MKLYELSEQFAELFDRFDEINEYTPEDGGDPEAGREKLRCAWFDTLTAIEDEFDVKAENVACYIKSMNAEIKAMKEEESALRRRRQAFENSVERLKGYLLGSMLAIGRSKIDTPRARLSVRNNAESIVIDDAAGFIGWAEENAVELLKYAAPEIRKTDAKKLLQAGEVLPFAHLTRTQSLTIK
ncbi:MAG: siphovirus Gp157 family protein [Ruminococcus sp.]|nr:siphovirus Gp157 family protein [Ruminococcus sp.]